MTQRQAELGGGGQGGKDEVASPMTPPLLPALLLPRGGAQPGLSRISPEAGLSLG